MRTPSSLFRPLLAGTTLALLALAGCDRDGRSAPLAAATAAPVASAAPAPLATALVLQLGADLSPRVAARVEELVRGVAGAAVELRGAQDDLSTVPPGSLVLALGDVAGARWLIPASDVQAAGSEGFVLRSGDLGGVTVLAADGNPPRPDPHGLGVNRGLSYGAYAALEELGFAFLHPLAPTLPPALALPGPVDRVEAPRWPERGWHLHTMHPLELTELLNGWGPGDPHDEPGWRAQLPEWERFCEWALANRQNAVEWLLLMGSSWQAFADGPERQARLRELVDIGHAWGLAIGADAPLALKQQHSWTMLRDLGDPAREVAQIQDRLDWLLAAGFDFVATEVGFSEFTHPDDRKMLAWLDAYTAHLAARGKKAWVKVHVSAGQECKNFVDPDTGAPLNFNFLPHYADPRLGVMPHTVQHYALDDPAPTYGNRDFGFMREFLQEEAGRREVLWHPETAYWVSFDVDVPLFLPVYAERRLHDLRLLAGDERAGRTGRGPQAGAPIQGQMVFSSGWEWGYWLNDVVTARGAWDPQEGAATLRDAVARALEPVVRPLGAAGPDVRDLLLDTMEAQRQLLIEGEVAGRAPQDVVRRNGQAYLQGWETWDDVSSMLLNVPGLSPAVTQPEKLGLVELRRGTLFPGRPSYAEVEPLLAEMDDRFGRLADRWDALRSRVPAHAAPLVDDMADAARMTALRARQVHGLYDWVDGLRRRAPDRARLQAARDALDAAQRVVARREQAYRVPADRIAGWRRNPTAYPYNYLWTARSLHYWWRDEGKAVDAPWSPAYLNVIDPLDVAFGEGFWIPLTRAAREFGRQHGLQGVTDLLAAPRTEPTYPQGGLRSRP